MAEKQRETALSPGHPLNGERVLRIPRSANNVPNLKKIGTWNIRSMYQSGKAANIIQEMKRLNIDILGCSEVRWPNSGKTIMDEYHIYYSGDDTARNRNGVAIIIKREIAKAVIGFTPMSDRVALLKIKSGPSHTNIIQVYAPTAESTEEEIERFYQTLEDSLKLTKKHEINIVMGDFNAKIGQGTVENVVGRYGLGTRNERGERLIQFCQETNMVVMNTFFKLHPRRLYTWKAPGDTPERIIRNQIDFINVNKRFQNSITSAKTYPGADVFSDHNLLVANINIRLKIIHKKVTPRKDIKLLKENDIQKKIKEELNKDFAKIGKNYTNNVEEQWNEMKTSITTLTYESLTSKKEKKQEWMTDEILHMMEERRKLKGRNVNEYNKLHKSILRKIKEAKETRLTEKCMEIENLQQKHDDFNMHKKIKEMQNTSKQYNTGIIVDNEGQILIRIEDRLRRWKQYMQELFEDPTRTTLEMNNPYGPEITNEEVEMAIKRLKDGKSPGPDDVHGEILKLLETPQITAITRLFNNIYETGHLPKDWLLSIFIPIPKKNNTRKCEDHRLISLMSHALKVLLNIIHSRIYTKLEEHLSEVQFGFRAGLGTREALFSLQVLIQRARDVNCDVFACFIDFEKAFDKVPHGKLIDILKTSGIDGKDISLISNLYLQQKATVRLENELSDIFPVGKGVRQGCILSPALFNIYSENLFREALDGSEDGIAVNGQYINNIRYADDTVLLADSAEGLQRVLDNVVKACNEYGLKLNCKKTKIMIISKNTINAQFTVDDTPLERVEKICYLGCNISDTWDHSYEIRTRIEKARSSFGRLKKVLCNLSLNINIRIRILRCYIFSVLLYGVESWSLTEATTKRLEAFEMWCYRRMLRVSYTHHTSNITILERLRKDKEIVTTVKNRKLAYFGHIMRNDKYRFLQLILQGKIKGKRGPGRRRISWLANLRKWTGLTSIELFRAAGNRIRWATVVANIIRR